VILSAHAVPASARSGGLINGGTALLEGVTSLLANPAILNRYCTLKESKAGFAYSYGRGSVFSDHIMTAAAAYSVSPQLTLGGLYRFLRQDEERYQNDFVLSASGRLFDRSIDRGPVDIGINARLEDTNWEMRDLARPATRTFRKDSVWTPTDTSFGRLPRNRMWEERRLSFDVGLYQHQFTDKLDFGLTFHDLIGYRWRQHMPVYGSVSREEIDSIAGDTTRIDSSFYTIDDGRDWIHSYHKRVSIGMLYHVRVVDGAALVQIPAQFDLLGVFDRGSDTHFTFRTGLEVWLRDSYCLRFGYARAPRIYPHDAATKEYDNDHIFGGGGSVLLDRFGIDLYVYGDEWGLGATMTL
jgi:hypothetical protein